MKKGSKRGWHEKQKYSPMLRRLVAPRHRKVRINAMGKKYDKVYKSNPIRTVQNFRELSELTEQEKQKELEERQKRRALQIAREKGERIYIPGFRDLRHEVNVTGKPFPLPESRRLENLGYEASDKKPVHTNERWAIKRKNYEKGLDTQFVSLGNNKWRVYSKEVKEKTYPFKGLRDQYGIIPGTAPKKKTKQSKLDHWVPYNPVLAPTPMEKPEFYDEVEKRISEEKKKVPKGDTGKVDIGGGQTMSFDEWSETFLTKDMGEKNKALSEKYKED